MEKIYIVTGAAGHLGSTIVRLLAESRQRVRGLLLPEEVPPVSGVEYVRGDILEPESMIPLFRREEGEQLVVIHAAGIVDVSGELFQTLYAVNVTGTKNVLALCLKYHADKLVYVSSVHAIPEAGNSELQTEIQTSLDKGIQGKEAKKVLPTLHKTPPNGTIGGVFVCGGKSLNPGPRGYAAPIVIRRYLQAWQTKPRPTPRRKRRAALPLPRRSRRDRR